MMTATEVLLRQKEQALKLEPHYEVMERRINFIMLCMACKIIVAVNDYGMTPEQLRNEIRWQDDGGTCFD